MLDSLKSTISRNITNAKGWKTNRKIVVIESDDWGSIRMPSIKIKEKYERLGYNLNKNPYCLFDTLANSEDLSSLFELLSKYKDYKNNHPIITFNTVVGNPKFDFIKSNNFELYQFESFKETLQRYYPNENTFQYWKEGVNSKLITPQYHGREHVNVPLWLNQLRENNKPILDAFNFGFWGLPSEMFLPKILDIQASYDSNSPENTEFYKKSISEGLQLFEAIFGFKSKSFIANNYVWSSELNSTLKENSIDYLQGMKYQKLPLDNLKKVREKIGLHTGLINKNNQLHLVRNCVFEPSQYPNRDNVSECLKQISQAFLFHKPAIITMHRLNVIGALSENNRNQNHKQLARLLHEIIKKWKNVEFMTTDELGDLIIESKNI
jgi:hypothetical protein